MVYLVATLGISIEASPNADPLPSCADLTGDNLFPQFDLAEMLFGNAYAFPGAVCWAGET